MNSLLASRRAGLPSRRRWLLLPLVAALALVATGCGAPKIVGDEGDEPVVLVVSETWVANHQGTSAGGAAGGQAVRARIADLQEAVTALRRETGTGWVGRQDDVTGYLADLSGGSWPGTATAFMDTYGASMFGVDSGTLRFGEPDTDTVPGIASTRATQSVGEVPVLDASLSFDARGPRLTGIRGRVFPELRVDTVPTIPAETAASTAATAAGGTTTGTPRLVVLPRDAGVLTWEIVVVGATSGPGGQEAGRYYVDAASGQVVDVRPVSTDLAAPVPGAAAYRASLPKGSPLRQSTRAPGLAAPQAPGSAQAADKDSVEITGADPIGAPLTGYGIQTKKGIQLVDTTTPAYDPEARKGVVRTYDASAIRSDSQLPGDLIRTLTPQVTDPEAMAAHVYSRDIAEYYETLGRDSWDNAGGDLVNSVHYGPTDFCNAFFTDFTPDPQMVYGGPCESGGEQLSASLVVPDVAAHEITHGVTSTSAKLLYTGQSGALNESFSDYFGNVIGDLIRGKDSASIGEDACVGIAGETPFCTTNPDGSRSLRYMLNGNDYDQYLRILNPGVRLSTLVGYDQDNGGVHINSAIWNNALWTIRSRLAQIDGQEALDSPLAKAFDRAVYGALATRLVSTSGFVDAADAVEQVIVDSQLDPAVLRVAREVFQAEKICAGCPTKTSLAGDSVTSTPQTQLHPVVSGDRAAWLDLSGLSEYEGYAASTTIGGAGAPSMGADGDSVEVAWAGDALLSLQFDGDVVRIAPGGSTQTLDTIDAFEGQVVGLGSSDAGGAWYNSRDDVVRYVDASGQTFESKVPGRGGDTIIALATGGGTVAAGTDQGKVFLWTPGNGSFRQLGQVSGSVLSLATYAGSVFTITDSLAATLLLSDGRTFDVSSQAFPFGAAMSSEYVVWPEAVGNAESGVAPEGSSGFPETDLFLLSLSSGKIYNLLEAPAQQGFPSISGDRLVWQDATLGGDDVFTATVPDGL